jgi:hypothetical protein
LRLVVAPSGVLPPAARPPRRAAARGETELAAEVLARTPEHPKPAKPTAPAPERKPGRQKPARRHRSQQERDPATVPAAAPAATAAASAAATAPARAAARVTAPIRPSRRDGGWTDWRFLAGEQVHVESVERELSWQLPAVLFGVLLSFAPLVRPLTDAAPWLAIAGLALVAAGWLGARRG